MTHPRVEQLRFARAELVRGLAGVTAEEAVQRIMPMNCISWSVGHLANQEQRYWLQLRGEEAVVPGLNALVGNGRPASTPPLDEMWEAWRAVTAAVDPWLDSLTEADLLAFPGSAPNPMGESTGTLMQRVTYHYWYHIGEGQAIRQVLGHVDLPQFVGSLGENAPYRAENA